MAWLITNFIAAFLLPPLNGILPLVLGLVMRRRWPRLGGGVLVLGLLSLVVCSLPVTGKYLMAGLEYRHPVLPQSALAGLDVDAVVVLGGGRYRQAPEFDGQDEIRQLTLDRVRYGAVVARTSGKPLLVSGGKPDGEGLSEADAMRNALQRDFAFTPTWLEGESANTRENALFTARILLPQGRKRIALVTHAFHMPRAVASFEAAGFQVTPAPTSYFSNRLPPSILDFLPRYDAVKTNGLALHEWIGLLWYRLRG